MLAQRGPTRIEAAEVDDVADAGSSRRSGESVCVGTVAISESGAAPHGVHQVENGVDAGKRGCVQPVVIEVERSVVDALERGEGLGAAAEAPDAVAGFDQASDERVTDESRWAGDADSSMGSDRSNCRRPSDPSGASHPRSAPQQSR